jgi:hypothetical protein
MLHTPLPISTFPAWARVNLIEVSDVELAEVLGKGHGFVATKELGVPTSSDKNTADDGALLNVPRDLVLSAEAVEDYAKVDQNFRQLLETSGKQVSDTVLITEPIRLTDSSLAEVTLYYISSLILSCTPGTQQSLRSGLLQHHGRNISGFSHLTSPCHLCGPRMSVIYSRGRH